MGRYLLDTNIIVALSKGDPAAIQRLRMLKPEQVCVCSVVKAELFYGARKSQRVEENLRGFEALMEPFTSLPFDDRAAQEYGFIRADLERMGTPIGSNDVIIAAIGRAHDCVVVTRNVREFERVLGLRVESWG